MLLKKVAPVGLALLGVAAGVSLMSADANAKGCNGYVNQLEWGCAPWDNNNGPQYPHYKKPETQPAKPAAAAPVVPPPSVAAGANAKAGAPIISTNGGGIVAQGAGNIVAQGAGNLKGGQSGIVAQGAGNLKNNGK